MQPSPPLLTDLLRAVSRSFYLTLRVLPAGVRAPIGLAYLLARATDTIADTELVPAAQRLAALRALRERIRGEHTRTLDLGELSRHQGAPAEKILLERCEEALALLADTPPADRQRIREVLAIITSGQELDLERFRGAGEKRIVALHTAAELDDYTYRVAGCVGEFWTRMCCAHVFPDVAFDEPALLADAVRFGKGLQLVNVLRDLPRDLRQGRCYLPADRLAALGLTPADLLEPANETKLRPLYDELLALAHAHLAAGWSYTNRLPRSTARVRLACAWPILIGVKTLTKLRTSAVLEGTHRLKVSRAEVRGVILRSVLLHPWPAAWVRQFQRAGD